jgi:hypothetical protein
MADWRGDETNGVAIPETRNNTATNELMQKKTPRSNQGCRGESV